MAFHADRWASAFLAVSGENAESAFQCFKAIAQPVKSMRGGFGHNTAAELEKMLRESVVTVNIPPPACDRQASPPQAVEYAIRFICLLVEKNYFKYIDILLPVIERKIDEQKNVLSFYLEAASEVDSDFEQQLEYHIRNETGAADVKLKTSVKPELLGGYRLRIGGFFIDASLKGQLAKMQAELEAVI